MITNQLHEKLSDEVFSKYFEEGNKLSIEEACQLSMTGFDLQK